MKQGKVTRKSQLRGSTLSRSNAKVNSSHEIDHNLSNFTSCSLSDFSEPEDREVLAGRFWLTDNESDNESGVDSDSATAQSQSLEQRLTDFIKDLENNNEKVTRETNRSRKRNKVKVEVK